MLIQALIASSVLLLGINPESTPEPEPEPETLHELLPGLHITKGIVEFSGTIAIDCHHPDTPDVYLEMFVTAPDSREHESLVVSSIKPSNLHAALLAAGFEPGSPLKRTREGTITPASGDALRIFVSTNDSETEQPEFIPIESWVVSDDADKPKQLVESPAWTGLVFAGSILNKHGYSADRGGTLISLTSFGDEVIAPTWTISHEADIDAPTWIANRDQVPKIDTRVRIRIEAIEEPESVKPETQPDPESHQPDRIDINSNP
tara:strand:- start:46295 stop:47080 length:786 start_codon:yes stop_codon:yes gene_type:complete